MTPPRYGASTIPRREKGTFARAYAQDSVPCALAELETTCAGRVRSCGLNGCVAPRSTSSRTASSSCAATPCNTEADVAFSGCEQRSRAGSPRKRFSQERKTSGTHNRNGSNRYGWRLVFGRARSPRYPFSRITNRESRILNRESKIESPESRIARIANRESRNTSRESRITN